MVYPHCYRTEHSETNTTNGVYGEYYKKLKSHKISIQRDLLKLLNYVDSYRNTIIKDCTTACELKSVSGKKETWEQCWQMIEYAEAWMLRLGINYEAFTIGNYTLNGETIQLPPILLGVLGRDSKKKTVRCISAKI